MTAHPVGHRAEPAPHVGRILVPLTDQSCVRDGNSPWRRHKIILTRCHLEKKVAKGTQASLIKAMET
jgi:hypothetical protein